ncbi:hypothetical protein O3W44_01355 [Pantoea sp. LMR881]|uniref:hypothetical protein n=1 Tax=Pantoea sp. LMR881 TaxID=3014336 RepID=UPI0022AEF778|nr:hypothetical protein [Pantoea sp. LMR881]MCZ4058017.1 hypothetical protein [Pantoea sp. LMR881]
MVRTCRPLLSLAIACLKANPMSLLRAIYPPLINTVFTYSSICKYIYASGRNKLISNAGEGEGNSMLPFCELLNIIQLPTLFELTLGGNKALLTASALQSLKAQNPPIFLNDIHIYAL